MKINDLATPFLASYEATRTYYEQYFESRPEAYEFYFKFHCKSKEESYRKRWFSIHISLVR